MSDQYKSPSSFDAPSLLRTSASPGVGRGSSSVQQQTSFPSSVSSLPGALGIGPSAVASSDHFSPSPSAARKEASGFGMESTGFRQQQSPRQPPQVAQHTPQRQSPHDYQQSSPYQYLRPQSDASSPQKRAGPPGPPSTSATAELYATPPSAARAGLDPSGMNDAAIESSRANGKSHDNFFERRSVSSTSLNMDAGGGSTSRPGSASNNSVASRKFMIPITGTGARQKLNVFNASQKPKPPSSTSKRPSTSSGGSPASERSTLNDRAVRRTGSSLGLFDGSSTSQGSSNMQHASSAVGKRPSTSSGMSRNSERGMPLEGASPRLDSSRAAGDSSTPRGGFDPFSGPQSHASSPRPKTSGSTHGRSGQSRSGAEHDWTANDSPWSQRQPSNSPVNGWTLVSTTPSPASAAASPSSPQMTNRWSSSSSANASPRQPALPVSAGWVIDSTSSSSTSIVDQSQFTTPKQEKPDPLTQRDSSGSSSSMRSLGSWRKALNSTPRKEGSSKGIQPSQSTRSFERTEPAEPSYSSPKADAILGRRRSPSNGSDTSAAQSPMSKPDNAGGKVRGSFRSLFQSKGGRQQTPPTETQTTFPPRNLRSSPDLPRDYAASGSQKLLSKDLRSSTSSSEREDKDNQDAGHVADLGNSSNGDLRSMSTDREGMLMTGGEGEGMMRLPGEQISPFAPRASEFAPTIDLNLPSVGRGLFEHSPSPNNSSLLSTGIADGAGSTSREATDVDANADATLQDVPSRSLQAKSGPDSRSNDLGRADELTSVPERASSKESIPKSASSWSQTSASAVASPSGSLRGSLLGLSSTEDFDRRSSTATVSSTASQTASKPADLTAMSSAPRDNGTAARSSRMLSPIDSEKPNVPLTSPLLAAVLDQQRRNASIATSSSQSLGAPFQSRESVSSGSITPSSRRNDSSSKSSTPSPTRSAAATPAALGVSPSTKPGLPLKSKDRLLRPSQGDSAAALAKIEQSEAANMDKTGPALAAAATAANTSAPAPPEMVKEPASDMAPPDGSEAAAAVAVGEAAARLQDDNDESEQRQIQTMPDASSSGQQKPAFDPATYVPPGALTRTRKGVTVLPLSSKPAIDTSQRISSGGQSTETNSSRSVADDGDEYTPRPSMDRSSLPKQNHVPMPISPVLRSRTFPNEEEQSGAHLVSRPDPVEEGRSDGQIISFNTADFEADEDSVSVDSGSLLSASAWAEVESSLERFKDTRMSTAADKGNLLRTILLPFLALEAEMPNVDVSGEGNFTSGKKRRSLFFDWIRYLLLELQNVQTSADRGAILESIACIIESRNLSAAILSTDLEDEKRFSSVFGHILSYAIGELNKKGVYQNTLIFSGRLLAVAFFRVEGVASKLLRALPVNRFALERVAQEAQWNEMQPRNWRIYAAKFPRPLRDFCFQDAKSYLQMLDEQTATAAAANNDAEDDDDRFLVRYPEAEVEMSGNWLRRWQSDDSELFFSFCRSYHRQLAGLFSSTRNLEAALKLFFGGPGYAHLATCIHQKCLSLVHRDILSVTTLSSQKNFNPGETANVLSGSTAGKPRHLEAANRRCSAIVVDIVRAPSTNNQIFASMLGIHVKCLVKRTSLYDVQGVFCLLDWMDGVLSHMETAELPAEQFIDIDFLLDTISLLLTHADHALALMRTVAFCYSNFAVLTSTTRHRTRFCEEILLNGRIFQKLFLSWSFTIRAYFLHLLVFRLARINDFPLTDEDPDNKTAVIVARLFNMRLDEIRARHDELSPPPSSTDSGSEEDAEEAGQSKGRPQSFVSTIRHTPSIQQSAEPGLAVSKAERVLGIGMPDPVLSSGKGESKTQSRAAKWLRALGGRSTSKNAKGNKSGPALSNASSLPSPVVENPFIMNEPRKPMPRVDEIDFDSEDDASGSRPSSSEGQSNSDTPKADDGQFDFGNDPSNVDLTRQQATSSPTSHHDNLAPDMAFDLQSPMATLPGDRTAPTTRSPAHQARISRAFSKRSSILPRPAFDLVSQDDGKTETGLEEEGDLRASTVDEHKGKPVKAEPYDRKLHTYAVQSLREYEQTVQEHDEYFAAQPEGEKAQVPKLPIQWPQMFEN